jgi:ABC-2 type transport system permease protein
MNAGQPVASSLWLPAASLTWRELRRFVRQRSRIVGALGTPIIFWVLIGAGLGSSFRTEAIIRDVSYLEYFFPGTLALILLFTAIFSTISVIEDRHEGFLQSVLVAPVGRASIALGKILGSTALASVQGLLFLLLAPLVGIHISMAQFGLLFVIVTLLGFALSGLGFLVAWRLDSVQGFHSIMNLVLIPMWLLSGALFPAAGAAAPLRVLLQINPLTYGVAALRHALYPADLIAAGHLPGLAASLAVTIAFGLATFAFAAWLVARPQAQ